MATQKQTDLCKAILRNCYTVFNYGLPPEGYEFRKADFQIWSECVNDHNADVKLPIGRALSGLIGSAKQAGLVGSDGECVWLTEAGFKLAIS